MKYTFYYQSVLGYIKISEENKLITGVELVEEKGPCHNRPLLKEAVKQLDQYFSYQRLNLDLPLAINGNEFEVAIYKALLTIPYGKTVSFKELAKRAGYENSFRRVSFVLKKNPFFMFLPSHRVISATGKVGSFQYGPYVKTRLLLHENPAYDGGFKRHK